MSGAAFLLVTASWPLAEWQLGRELSPAVARVEPLSTIPGWNASDQQVADWSPGYGNCRRRFGLSTNRKVVVLGLQIVYYRNQDHERKLAPGSTNVLVESRIRTGTRWRGAHIGQVGNRDYRRAHGRIVVGELAALARLALVLDQWLSDGKRCQGQGL